MAQSLPAIQIQKVIEEDGLYPDPISAKRARNRQVQAKSHHRQRITKLVRQRQVNYLRHVDTVILTLSSGGYRYLMTAIDEVSKMAYARLYATHSTRAASDFLARLVYLTDNQLINLQHGNGSKFKLEFEAACKTWKIPQWYSRPHTPKDNAVLERFNRTIQEEFVQMSEPDIFYVDEFNQPLTDWLIEYN